MADSEPEYSDVLIIGAGISGIGAAYRITEQNPQLTYTILERRARIGGTWDLFRYPGIRSDSDIFTLSLLVRAVDAAGERGRGRADPRLPDGDRAQARHRSPHPVQHPRAIRRLGLDHRHLDRAHRRSDGAEQSYRGRFLFFGTGYYNYDAPYTPEFPGIENFAGTVVHPQFWPESLDYSGKRVVVIGSGATAISMIPALAKKAAQRDDAAALADVHDVDRRASIRWLRSFGRYCRASCLSCGRALVLQDRDHWQLLVRPQGAADLQEVGQGNRAPTSARRLRRRHPLQAAVQPMGSADVRDRRG